MHCLDTLRHVIWWVLPLSWRWFVTRLFYHKLFQQSCSRFVPQGEGFFVTLCTDSTKFNNKCYTAIVNVNVHCFIYRRPITTLQFLFLFLSSCFCYLTLCSQFYLHKTNNISHKNMSVSHLFCKCLVRVSWRSITSRVTCTTTGGYVWTTMGCHGNLLYIDSRVG